MSEADVILASVESLTADQQLLFEDLEEGLDSRRELVVWLHRAAVLTLGRLPDSWFADTMGHRYRTRALLDGPTRTTPDAGGVDRLGKLERELVADEDLLEAARKAVRFLSRHAQEYAGEEDEQYRPEDQKYTAMLPAVEDLATRQRTVLKEVLGMGANPSRGLEDREDLRRWTHSLLRATRGADGDLLQRATWDLYWRETLTGDVEAPTLHLLLTNELLPVMNGTIRETAQAAREVPQETRENHGAFDV